MLALLLDTETTNAEAGTESCEVIELAWGEVSFVEGWWLQMSGMWKERFKPKKQTSFGALAVHHILPSELEGCRDSVNARMPLPGVRYLIGHNIDFDWRALGKPDYKRICTLALSRSLFPECDAHSLTAMTYYISGATETTRDSLRNAHSAEVDIRNNFSLLQHIVKTLGCHTMEDLWVCSEKARIPTTMTFGKYKGEKICNVDRGWVKWYVGQPDTDPYLIKAFESVGLLPRGYACLGEN